MSNPIFYYQHITDSTITASAGSDADYPTDNLLDKLYETQWKSNDDSINQLLKIDFGSGITRNMEYVLIAHHNFASLNLRYLTFSVSADGSAWTDQVVLDPGDITDPLVVNFSDPIARRYLGIYLDKEASDTLDAVPALGLVLSGLKFDAGYTHVFPYKAGNLQYATSRKRALKGTLRTAQVYGGIRTFEIKFESMPNVFKTDWLTFHQSVRGALNPFYFADTDGSLYYVALAADANDIETFRYQLNNSGAIQMEAQTTEE